MTATVSIHDRYQLEMKVNYSLQQGCRDGVYEFDLYLFAPQSLDINAATYSKEQFYKDLQARIRLKTPSIPLHLLLENKSSALAKLRASVEAQAAQTQKDPPVGYEKQIKIFCCLVRSAIRDSVIHIQAVPHADDRTRLISHYVESVRKLASVYRDLRSIIQISGVEKRTFDLYSFGDEYISLLIEDYTAQLSGASSTLKTTLSPKQQESLHDVIRDEIQYRQARGYPSIADLDTDNELLLFRKSVLKKFVASTLFLDTEVKQTGQFVSHTLYGLAAALAMTLAMAITLISQSIFGTFTLPVFIALVVSYVFRDRFKDIMRLYWSRRATRHLFDHTTRIHNAAHTVMMGKCKESFGFIAESKVPDDIHKLRDRQHITEIENGWPGEQVLLYRKRVRLYPEKVRQVFPDYPVEGIHDIIRLNVQEFLRKMDDPKKELLVMDDEGLLPVKGNRVYHLNLILRLEHDGVSSCNRHRLVLNRKGLLRIEYVNSL